MLPCLALTWVLGFQIGRASILPIESCPLALFFYVTFPLPSFVTECFLIFALFFNGVKTDAKVTRNKMRILFLSISFYLVYSESMCHHHSLNLLNIPDEMEIILKQCESFIQTFVLKYT